MSDSTTPPLEGPVCPVHGVHHHQQHDGDVIYGPPAVDGSCRIKAGDVEVEGRVTDEVIRAYEAVHRARREDHVAAQEAARGRRERRVLRQSPWVSGSFYLVLFVAVTATLLVAASLLSLWALPVVLVGGLLAISVVGALQLRQDNKLSERGFLRLMITAVEKLPAALTSRTATPSSDAGNSPGGDAAGP